jgi:hypothetical protein
MTFHKTNSWKELLPQLTSIKSKCNCILGILGVAEDDVRAEGMRNIRGFCNTIALIPIKLQQNVQERPENIRPILIILGLTNRKALKSVLTDFNNNSKASFITMVQFAIENCIAQVIEAMGSKQPTGKFSRNIKLLLQLCSIPDLQRKLDLLLVPAMLRNTLHSNGIHKWPSKTVTVDGEDFVFEKDSRVSCGSWSHIFHAVKNSLSIYEEIFTSERIRTIRYIRAK